MSVSSLSRPKLKRGDVVELVADRQPDPEAAVDRHVHEIVSPQSRPCAGIVRGYCVILQFCGVVSVHVVEPAKYCGASPAVDSAPT